MVRWLRLQASTAGDAGLIPGRGTKIPHAMWWTKKKGGGESGDGWVVFSVMAVINMITMGRF